MTSQKQIESNRENAQHSTGANTPEGQAVSRMNAVTHGGYTKDPVLPWENRAEFEALKEDLMTYYQPECIMEAVYIETMVDVLWRRRRISIQDARLWQQYQDDPGLLNEHLDRLDKLDSRLQRKFERNRDALEKLKLERLNMEIQAQYGLVNKIPVGKKPTLKDKIDACRSPYENMPLDEWIATVIEPYQAAQRQQAEGEVAYEANLEDSAQSQAQAEAETEAPQQPLPGQPGYKPSMHVPYPYGKKVQQPPSQQGDTPPPQAEEEDPPPYPQPY